MTRYSLSPQAENDLWEIWRFIARDNPSSATKVVEAAYKTFGVLAASPKIGKAHPDLVSPEHQIRSMRVAGFTKYLIFYRPVDRGIQVLRVYHVARDGGSLLNR